MRVLFVTHDISNYGASRSLQSLISYLRLENVHCELVVRNKLFGNIDKDDIKRRFHVEDVHCLWIPFWNCYVGRKEALNIKEKLWMLFVNCLIFFTKNQLLKLARAQRFDVIHLNSIVLLKLTEASFPIIVHVRELLDKEFQNEAAIHLKCCGGAICIDDIVHEPIKDITINNSLILPNPFELNDQSDWTPGEKQTKLLATIKGKFIVTIVGRVTAEKGINFLLDFLQFFRDDRFVLLVVGDGELISNCKRFSIDDPRLIVYGEEENIQFIYKIANLVIRGEDIPRIGRTVYEAVFAGSLVLLPGNSADYPLELCEKYPSQVFFYKTRDVRDFSKQVLDLLEKGTIERKEKISSPYVTTELLEFYRKVSR